MQRTKGTSVLDQLCAGGTYSKGGRRKSRLWQPPGNNPKSRVQKEQKKDSKHKGKILGRRRHKKEHVSRRDTERKSPRLGPKIPKLHKAQSAHCSNFLPTAETPLRQTRSDEVSDSKKKRRHRRHRKKLVRADSHSPKNHQTRSHRNLPPEMTRLGHSADSLRSRSHGDQPSQRSHKVSRRPRLKNSQTHSPGLKRSMSDTALAARRRERERTTEILHVSNSPPSMAALRVQSIDTSFEDLKTFKFPVDENLKTPIVSTAPATGNHVDNAMAVISQHVDDIKTTVDMKNADPYVLARVLSCIVNMKNLMLEQVMSEELENVRSAEKANRWAYNDVRTDSGFWDLPAS